MAIPIHDEPVPLRRDDDGAIRVARTRVPLDTVIIAFHQGSSAEAIVEQYDSLDLADVYAVIAYYLRHRVEVDDYMRLRDEEATKVRAENELRFPSKGLRAKLLARRAASR